MNIRDYIDRFRRMGIAPATERQVLRELYFHLEEEAQDLVEAGMSGEEAVRQVVERFGPPERVARGMSEVHAKGSLREAFMAAAPHLLIAITFIFHFWRSSSWLVFLAALVAGLVLYGWWHGRPGWLYPWLGYSLVPVLALLFVAVFLTGQAASLVWFHRPLAGAWFWIAVGAYVPLALGLLLAVASRVARHDWIYASLMFLPLPLMAGWALRLQQQGKLLEVEEGRRRLQDMDPGMALIFVILALVAALFIRLRQRLLKIALLLVTTLAVLSLVSLGTEVHLNLVGFLLIASALIFFLFSPALLEHWAGPREEPWAEPTWLDQAFGQGWRRAT